MPREVCVQCSGWGQPWSLEHGEWDVARESDGTDIDPEKVD